MPRRSEPVSKPKDYMSGTWPNGRFVKGAPTEARKAHQVAKTLSEAVEDLSVSDLAVKARVSRGTIYAVLRGDSWPDFVTMTRLEEALATSLWPRD